ncbi:elongation factor p [Quercus suber]|uniref:Elongation factor p n=1 Tax=Quercus suber TaxID=58331 RepID=A0AAW0L9A3_QUESU
MRALQLSKNLSRTLFFTASSSSFPYRTITTATSTSTTALLSSPACHNHIHRRSDTWLSPSSSANLLRSPWSLTQHRGIRVSGSDVKVGNVIEKKGRIYQVVKTDHSHEGRGKATIKVELRDIESGNKVSQRLGTDESVETGSVPGVVWQRCKVFTRDKKVVLENGLTVEVPMFVVAGDAVVINTETDSYLER